MKKTKLNLLWTNIFTAIFIIVGFVVSAPAANVVQRGRVSASSNSAPATRGASARTSAIRATTTTDDTTPEPESEPETTPIVDKSLQFTVNKSITDTDTDDAIARQRAALDAKLTTETSKAKNARNDGTNKCDTGLRKCMAEKCGSDFTDCRTDTSTIWGSKMDSCRAKSECSATEYATFSAEIKADRDMASSMATYNHILECGNSYNECIINQCGATYSKCLGKAAIDAAIASCKSVAQKCTEYDSGLAARIGDFIAVLREDAEIRVTQDELRLYELRTNMANQCKALGATLDERTMNCVYTVKFYGDYDSKETLFASKKAYAGNTFSCTPNWFGVDVTTFKENAYRLTRGQTAASSAMLGSGAGILGGMITSGALTRAMDTQNAEKALKKAENEHEEKFGVPDGVTTGDTGLSGTYTKFTPPANADHVWYSDNCGGLDIDSINIDICKSQYMPGNTCNGGWDIGSNGDCSFNDGDSEKTRRCKECSAASDNFLQCKREQLDFCQKLDKRLLSSSKRNKKRS